MNPDLKPSARSWRPFSDSGEAASGVPSAARKEPPKVLMAYATFTVKPSYL